jgi:hypothetical protein
MLAIPAEDIACLRNSRNPGPDWWIAIAHYQDEEPYDYWQGIWGMKLSRLPDPRPIGPEHCNTQVTTLVAGKLCAHLFSSTVWHGFRGYEGASLAQIWPPRQFDIDTRHLTYIDNAGLPLLHEAVARDGIQPDPT